MSEKLKIVLGVVIGIVCAVMLFCLIIAVACSVNGLTFSEQICEWFSLNAPAIEATEKQMSLATP